MIRGGHVRLPLEWAGHGRHYVVAACSCGWRSGPRRPDDAGAVDQLVAAHVAHVAHVAADLVPRQRRPS